MTGKANAMRPLRRKEHHEVTDGRMPGQERSLESTCETDILSDEGSIDTVGKHRRYACDCGCYGAAGGRCADCNALSCVDCHAHCAACGRPLCLECSVFVSGGDPQAVRFCRSCHIQIARRRRLARAARFLLSPFVKFGSDDDTQR